MNKKSDAKKVLLAASVAGLLAVTGMLTASNTVYAEDVQCSGINACKGTGACGGEGHSCAGKNECKGLGWLKVATAEDCTAQGGTVLPAAVPAVPAA